MLDVWTGEVRGTMHIYEISMVELADEMKVSVTYLSSLLHCRKKSQDGEFKTRNALAAIVKRRQEEETKGGGA